MAASEDCASVLEGFMHDAANLPAEINHMMEEIQAKDKELQKHLTVITQKDGNLQKHIKANGVLTPHPKENEYAEAIKRNYELCAGLQSQKLALSEKACNLLERQVKRLDAKIRELQNDGQLLDGPPLPSVFNRKPEVQKPFMDMPSSMPLQAASVSTLNANAHRANAQQAPTPQQPQRQLPQIANINTSVQRSSAPATPASNVQQQRQREREHSAGADTKRRKLGNPLAAANIPAQPSGLRQSSLGPGTPKAGTPTGTSASRAGSVPRATAPAQATGPTKRSGLSKKVVSHQQVNKLKQKGTNKSRISTGRKKGQSPSVRGGRGGTAASEDGSALSSADASETDASQSRIRRGNKKAPNRDAEMGEDEEVDEDDADDDKVYCYCRQRSYGEMVACENDDCQYQWFHTGCLKLTKLPEEDEDWFCPTCREKPEIKERMQKQKKAARK